MNFRDDKVYKYKAHTFEHARIVQGTLIYFVVVVLIVGGFFSGQARAATLVALAVVSTYALLVLLYVHRRQPLNDALVLAFLRLLTLPTSMVG